MSEKFKDIIKIAHRGFRFGVDENTFIAFNKSVEFGMDFIEFDVQISKDGELVIIHDATVNRTFKGFGKVKNKTLAKLKKLKGRNFGGKLPTARETITKYKDKIKLMIEIKDPNAPEKLAEMVKETGSNDRVVFSGRDPAEFIRIKKILPDAKFCLNITSCKSLPLDKFLKIKKSEDLPIFFDMISLSTQRMSVEYVKKCKEFNIIPLCWNFSKVEDPYKLALEMIDMGVEGILFDHPTVFKE